MSTSYDVKVRTNICECCNRADEADFELGVSSSGWAFMLNAYPSKGLETLIQWQEFIARPGVTVEDEYGKIITPEEMTRIIHQDWIGGTTRLLSQLRRQPHRIGFGRSYDIVLNE